MVSLLAVSSLQTGERAPDIALIAYMSSFGRNAQFDACADMDSVAIRLVRPGEDRREAVVHLHYGPLAEILAELARSLAARDPLDEQHRSELGQAARQLAAALQPHEKS